jgi:hypothetical protein
MDRPWQEMTKDEKLDRLHRDLDLMQSNLHDAIVEVGLQIRELSGDLKRK